MSGRLAALRAQGLLHASCCPQCLCVLPPTHALPSLCLTAAHNALPASMQHCTHEARGLDVLPQTIHRFRSNGDGASADLLQVREGPSSRGVAASFIGRPAQPAVALLVGSCKGAFQCRQAFSGSSMQLSSCPAQAVWVRRSHPGCLAHAHTFTQVLLVLLVPSLYPFDCPRT